MKTGNIPEILEMLRKMYDMEVSDKEEAARSFGTERSKMFGMLCDKVVQLINKQ